MDGRFSYTAKEVDNIVNAQKYIDSFPNININESYMNVYMEDGAPVKLIFRLVVRRTFGTSLVLSGQKIRGYNTKEAHMNPDGSTVKGWHKHIYCPKGINKTWIYPADRNFSGAEELVKFCLQKWNIRIKPAYNIPPNLFS